MKKKFLSICLTTFLLSIFAQNMNETLFSVGDDSVSVSEFINTFTRNNSLEKATKKEVRDYLELYINFKLKVKDGLDSQIDTTPTFQRELASYRSQSAKSYLVDKEVSDRLIEEAVERSKLMVRASHILIRSPQDATPKDSLIAYNKALDIRKKIVSGNISFPEAAVQFSDDLSAKDERLPNGRMQYGNKGDLGYFSTFDLIYPFESAAYNTPVGSYSMPFRTQFGYHIIWVQDKQPIVPKISISQILLIDSTAHAGNMTPEVKETLALIDKALKQGEDFETLAEQYTEDPSSKGKGGLIDPITYKNRPGDFIKNCITLKNDQISKPFPSVVGWHIVKLNELIIPEANEEEKRYSLVSRIQRDSRSTKSVESLVEKLKKEYRYSEVNKNAAFSLLSNAFEKEMNIPSVTELLAIEGIEKLNPLATFANQNITLHSFLQYLDRFKGSERNSTANHFLETQYNLFLKDNIIKYEYENLENKYPDYKELISEYHHGMILFEMNNEKIWSESLKDSANLEAFYEKSISNYLNNEGVPKPLAEIRSIVLTDYQHELEKLWLNQLMERYPVWINEELFNSILINK